MRKCAYLSALAAILVLVSCPRAHAQMFEDVGTRAQGMSGAFVGVADDATAVWWNPAGLATGALLDVVFEKGRTTEPEHPVVNAPARRPSVAGFALSFPSLGLSYYRLRISQITSPNSTELLLPNRQNDGGVAEVQSREFTQVGVTIGQSLLDHLVIGSTVKVIRGGEGTTVIDPQRDALDQGDAIDLSQEIHGDLDMGLMFAFPHVQAGLTVRNLTTPEFGDGNTRFELKRQARAGIALLGRTPGVIQAMTLAADADLTRTTTPFGDVRHAGLGGEVWFAKKRVGVRGGVATNTIGERRWTRSTGVSVRTISSLYIEGAGTFGSDESIRGWSTTARITF